jgi:heptosyltransferase-2
VPQRILVKAVNWLGDLVMSLPALRAVRDGFPDATLAVMVKTNLAGFFDGLGWVDEIIPYRAERGLRAFSMNRQVIRALKKRHFDLAILFPNSFKSALWMARARIPTRVGYATDGRGLMLTRRLTPARDALDGHQSLYWCGIVRDGLGLTIADGTNTCLLQPAPKACERMRSWLGERRERSERPLIVIAAAAAYGPAKEWPAERFAELIERVAQGYDAECVIIGTAAERARCEYIAQASLVRSILAAGELSVSEMIAMISLSDGFVGNDSGAMHVAAALGIPTVGLFGSTNPRRTGPRGPHVSVLYKPPPCSPCLKRTCPFNHYDCQKAVSVEEVVEALARLNVFASR